jgi:hypothetical protein
MNILFANSTGPLIRAAPREERVMAKKLKSQCVFPEKECWRLCDLQNLNPEKFIKVVGKILKKKYLLIK